MLTGEDAAHMPSGADAKWRFFWRYAHLFPFALSKSHHLAAWASSPRTPSFPSSTLPR